MTDKLDTIFIDALASDVKQANLQSIHFPSLNPDKAEIKIKTKKIKNETVFTVFLTNSENQPLLRYSKKYRTSEITKLEQIKLNLVQDAKAELQRNLLFIHRILATLDLLEIRIKLHEE